MQLASETLLSPPQVAVPNIVTRIGHRPLAGFTSEAISLCVLLFAASIDIPCTHQPQSLQRVVLILALHCREDEKEFTGFVALTLLVNVISICIARSKKGRTLLPGRCAE